MRKTILFITLSFCLNFFGFDAVVSAIRRLLATAIGATSKLISNGKSSPGLIKNNIATELPENATAFDRAAHQAGQIMSGLANEQVIRVVVHAMLKSVMFQKIELCCKCHLRN